MGVTHFEEGLEGFSLLKCLAELPDGVLVRHRIGEAETEEVLEGKAVQDLELAGLVGKMVKTLEDQDFAGGTESDLLTDEKGGPRLVGSGFDLGASESLAPITLMATNKRNGQVSLKWSASLPGLIVLEESADFNKWNGVTQPAALVSGKLVVDIASSPSAGQIFYRLHQQ